MTDPLLDPVLALALMKVVGTDASLHTLKELACELSYVDTASKIVWLHR